MDSNKLSYDLTNMYPNIRQMLAHSIEQGIGDGIVNAKEHYDDELLATSIENYIWLYIDQFFTFTEKFED